MNRKFFSGSTLEQALISAASHFGIAPERVAYKEREKKHGFLKARRRVVIEVDADAPERSPEAAPVPLSAEPAPMSERLATESVEDVLGDVEKDEVEDYEDEDEDEDEGENEDDWGDQEDENWEGEEDEDEVEDEEDEDYEDEDEEDDDEEDEDYEDEDEDDERPRPSHGKLSATAAVERATREVLRFLKIEADIHLERRKDYFEIDISTDDSDDLLADDGKLLQAMEYLIPRIARAWVNRGMPVKVDCDGFRAAHEQELTDLALRVAEEVRDEGEEQILEPMNPADRRLIHLALVDDPDVETESEGRGYFKRVRIIPIDFDDSRS